VKQTPNKFYSPIGIFDSGYGGLTVMKEIVKMLPQYDYLYLGDNARAPYGTRSFETVYEYTLQCVKKLCEHNCKLVILACNTASAKALRNIQQKDLPGLGSDKRVLGVIRPTSEIVGNFSKTKHIGVLGTSGTINSNSYPIEIAKFFPEIKVSQEACPMWVPLVENGEYNNPGADYFIEKNVDALLKKDEQIDTIILGCTHYPLLSSKIQQHLPAGIKLLSQGELVATSLKDYMLRHPEMDANCSKNSKREFLSTDASDNFDTAAGIFYGAPIKSKQIMI